MKSFCMLMAFTWISSLSDAQLCATREWHVHQDRSAKIDTNHIAGIDEHYNFWPAGQIITVGFVNGTPHQQQVILAIAKEWESFGNIRFAAAEATRAMVRIRFSQTMANFTYIGTDVLEVPSHKETMQLDESLLLKNRQQLRQVVLHQFGHVLGMVHEFNPPETGIAWNKRQLYKKYRRAGLTKSEVRQNIFQLYTHRITNGWFFDQGSIMHLSFSVMDAHAYLPMYGNTVISEGDRFWMEARYSFVKAPVEMRYPELHTPYISGRRYFCRNQW